MEILKGGTGSSNVVNKQEEFASRDERYTGASGSLFSGSKIRSLPKDWKEPTVNNNKIENNLLFPPLRSACTKWSVVTTIFEVSEGIMRASQLGNGWCLVIVADLATPSNYMEKSGLDQNLQVHFCRWTTKKK